MQVSIRRFTFPLAVFLAITLFLSEGFSQEPQQKAQLYFFTNAACGPCRLVEPELEKLYRAGYPVMKIDTHRHPEWTRRFQIRKTPTVVLVANQKVVAQHSGFVDAATMQGWFRQLDSAKKATKAQPRETNKERTPSLPSTCHQGTCRPTSTGEQLAMQATVRLKVDDDEGSSYATGTVIHYQAGDALVLTCGHVFRDSGGRGVISAEYGFDGDVRKVSSGELIFYDADARDVALVAIRTDRVIEPVAVAPVSYRIEKTDEIFSIGCDNGATPTIRHSLIKNQAKYDGVEKYEIYGRPVSGRSGGGLFTPDGKLVGVCNAAVVDVDEGVYAALDTIHWQFEKKNLAHLFNHPFEANPTQSFAEARSRQSQPRDFSDVPARPARQFDSDRGVFTLASDNGRSRRNHPPSQFNTEQELIVVLRSRNGNSAESFTINNPGPELLKRLRSAQQLPAGQNMEDRLARMRRDMPNLQGDSGNNCRMSDMRAQSPR